MIDGWRLRVQVSVEGGMLRAGYASTLVGSRAKTTQLSLKIYPQETRPLLG